MADIIPPPVEAGVTIKAELPLNVVKHVLGLMKGIQPAADWQPETLRNHADTKETFAALQQTIKDKEKAEVKADKEGAAK